MRLFGELPQVFFGEVRSDFVNVMETELNMNLSSVEGVKLQSMSVDIPSVLDLMAVRHEILEVFALEIDSLSQLGNISNAFYFLANQIGKNVGSLFSIGSFCLSQIDYLLLLYNQHIARNLSDLTGV